MTRESSADCDGLVVQHAQICFVYTFLCSRVNMGKTFAERNREVTFERYLQRRCKYGSAQVHWAGEPLGAGYREDEHQVSYLDPFLHLKIPHIHLRLPERKFRVACSSGSELTRQVSSVNVGLSGNVIVMDCGWGRAFYTMDVRAVDSNGFSKEVIIELSNLGLRRERASSRRGKEDGVCRLRLVGGKGDEVLLFFLFWRDTQGALRDINKGLKTLHVPGIGKLEWIEVKENLVGRGKLVDSTGATPVTYFQNPFPIMVLEIPAAQYAVAFLPDEQAAVFMESVHSRRPPCRQVAEISQERLVRDMLSVLFRSREWHFPDMTFARSCGVLDGASLVNMCSTSRIFLHLYSRSCLVVSPQLDVDGTGNVTAEPASYILPMLLSTVSSLRCRWHACVTMGKWLDKLIESMTMPGVNPERCLNEMISIETNIARLIVDPITYRAGSGSLNKLYEVGLSLFRIRDLERVVMDKLTVIDRLYLDLHERQRIKEFEKMEERSSGENQGS